MATWLALRLERSRWKKVEVLPIAGKGQPEGHTGPYDAKLFQPFSCMVRVRKNFSRVFAPAPPHWTRRYKIVGDKGVITIPTTSK